MGSVYIDEEFKNYLVPFSQRSASTATKTIVRGSNVSIGKDAKAIRAFIWWTNIGNGKRDDYYDSGRVDIDLSAAMFDENWKYIDHVSYTRLRSGAMEAYHSGDITNGGRYNSKGVAEFLDVNINAVGKRGRYIVFQVYNFTGQKFSEWDHCRFGWMEREDVDSGEIFEPSTVQMSLDVNSDSSVAIPVIFDCKERKFIWCDMNLSINNVRNHRGGNNLESNLSGVAATCYAMTHLSKPNLYDLVMLNAAARGTIVTDRNSADIIFSNDTTVPIETIVVQDEESGDIKTTTRGKKDVQIITAYDLDYFMGKMI